MCLADFFSGWLAAILLCGCLVCALVACFWLRAVGCGMAAGAIEKRKREGDEQDWMGKDSVVIESAHRGGIGGCSYVFSLNSYAILEKKNHLNKSETMF